MMSVSGLFNSYLRKEQEWEKSVTDLIGGSPVLIGESFDTLDSRIYQLNHRVIKIRRHQDCDAKETRLHREYEIIVYLDRALHGYNFMPHYESKNGFELLSINHMNGVLVERLLETKQLSLIHLIKIFLAILAINLKGISHRDLKSNNMIFDETGKIKLIDFDQAVKTAPIKAIINDIFGIGLGIPGAIHPSRRLLQRVVSYKLPGLIKLLIRPNTATRFNDQVMTLQLSDISSMDFGLLKLKEAWEIAARSNANSPGAAAAYYSLSINGFGFVGERSWESRWSAIKNTVNFQNKTVLELGCNMGLFSTFIRLAGAKQCVGLDADSEILLSARLIAEAFGADNEYKTLDFDDDTPWEDEYEGYDFAIALSVLNWVKDKQRLLNFLSKHKELLYEGHDSFGIEYDRLRSCGFKTLQIISVSERGRIIFYAKNS